MTAARPVRPRPRAARRGLACALAALLGAALVSAGCEPKSTPPPLEAAPPVTDSSRLHIAGDEAATPLFRHLADHFSARRPGAAVVVESPLGAAGARRALADGALDAALVVEPFSANVAAGVPIAVTRATLVTGAASSLRQVSPAELDALLRGEARPGEASHTMLLADPDDPAQRALAHATPPLEAAFAEATTARRWPMFFDGVALRDAVRRTPGAFAVTDTGSLRMLAVPLWQVRLVPAPAFDDRLVLRLVPAESPRPRLLEFIAFLRSPEGQALTADVGYMLP